MSKKKPSDKRRHQHRQRQQEAEQRQQAQEAWERDYHAGEGHVEHGGLIAWRRPCGCIAIWGLPHQLRAASAGGRSACEIYAAMLEAAGAAAAPGATEEERWISEEEFWTISSAFDRFGNPIRKPAA